MHETYETPYRLPIPKAPFRAFEFDERMAANGSVRDAVYALGKLFQILKSHADVEPIQHVLALWCNLAMDCTQPSIAIGENGHSSVFVYSAPAERQTGRFRRFGTSVAHKSKTRCLSLTIQHLACDNFKIAFRSPMSSAHVSAVQADNHFFTRFLDRRSREGFSGLFKPLADLHRAVAYCTDRCLCR
jgi:hypothetical protein